MMGARFKCDVGCGSLQRRLILYRGKGIGFGMGVSISEVSSFTYHLPILI
jgi:hypothetical protein